MKTLPETTTPTPEQLAIISNPRYGVQLIRGAAGSGKTTTALLMLRQLSKFWVRNKARQNIHGGTRVLVITFNRTLRGYILDLAQRQIPHSSQLNLTVSTFGRWSKGYFPYFDVLEDRVREAKIKQLAINILLQDNFILEEVDYLLGRFPANQLDNYLTCRRDGRGQMPRVDRNLRRKILDEIIHPYNEWKDQNGYYDWNDLALHQLNVNITPKYEIIIVDEAQDLSANQVRAIVHFAADPSSIVFVLDAAQRIYPRGFIWNEAGISIRQGQSYRLQENHRNTRQICQFAEPLLKDLDIGDDGTFPDFSSCTRNGPLPLVIVSRYRNQVNHVIDHIRSHIDLRNESVAFLKPRGGGWFRELKGELRRNSLEYVELTREDEWPTGPENIALSTMHSAKGLEFDHVFIIGLNEEITPHGSDEGDSLFENWRRILAMAITRARVSVIIGYKPGEASSLIPLLDPNTYQKVTL